MTPMLVNERDDDHLSALWLATLQSLTDSVVHDIRNTLNGVAVNLEVVRSRSARGAEGASIAPFAAAATSQFELASGQTDALIALVRAQKDGGDVAVLLGRLATLFGQPSVGNPVRIEIPTAAGVATGAPFTAVRLVLVAALLAGRAREDTLGCRLGTERPPTVYIQGEAGGPITLPPDIAAALEKTGISVTPSAHGITIFFPPSPA
jgi:hypothetical protein